MYRTKERPRTISSRVLPIACLGALLWNPTRADAQPLEADPVITQWISQIQSTALAERIGGLTGEHAIPVGDTYYTLTTRHSKSGEPIDMATQYVREFLQGVGLQAQYHEWGTCWPARNVVGDKPGLTRPGEIVLVTAHLDDIAPASATPGADDNASGTAAVMEAARVLGPNPFERTTRFVLFTGEEQGMLGSQRYANQLRDAGENVVGVYNLDMIGWDSDASPTVRLHTDLAGAVGYEAQVSLAERFQEVAALYGFGSALLPVIDSDGLANSDHASFRSAGFSALGVSEDNRDDFNPNYHTANDTLASLNLAYLTNIAKVSVAAAAHLAVRYVLPFYVTVEPTSAESCRTGVTTLTLKAGANGGSPGAVTLSLGGLPTGSSAAFGSNPLLPGSSTAVTITNNGAVAPGAYNLTLSGTAAGTTHSSAVHLTVVSPTQAAVRLTTPANAATGQSRRPNFTWSAASPTGVRYEVQVATDAAMTQIVRQATVSAPSYSPDTSYGRGHSGEGPLAAQTRYYWRVRAVNACGPGPYSAISSFTTGPAPTVLVVDDGNRCPGVNSYYTDALDSLGISYDIYDTGFSDVEPDIAMLSRYAAVVWHSGEQMGAPAGPGATGQAALAEYLTAGGRLFFVSPGYLYRPTSTFNSDYLGVTTYEQLAQHYTASGTGVFGNATYTLAYPDGAAPWFGASLQPGDDAFVATETQAVFALAGDRRAANGAVAKRSGAFRTTFWGFPFEAIPGPEARAEVMGHVLSWLLSTGTVGDVNLDNKVDIVDALMIAQHYVGLKPAPFDPTVADVNCDGQVDIVDALMVSQFYVGTLPSLCTPAP
jgi:hypothetical protein